MPKISSFSPKSEIRIDERVQSATIDKTGAGKVAQAVASIGQRGANLANKFLLEEKKEEAFNYANREKTNKSLAREEYKNEVRPMVDGVTGLLPSGKSFTQDIEEWEDKYDDVIREEAPTDLAKKTYFAGDSASKRESILEASTWELDVKRDSGRKQLTRTTNTRAKKLGSLNSDYLRRVNTNLTQETEQEMKEAFGDIERFHSTSLSTGPIERNKDIKDKLNSLSRSGTESMLKNKSYSEVLKNMGVGQLLEKDAQFQEQMRAKMSEILKDEIKEVRMNQGLIESTTSNEDRVYYDPDKGTVVEIPEISVKGSVVEGKSPEPPEFKPGIILEYLTPEQQRTYINRALSGTKQASKASNRLLLDRATNQMSAMMEPLGNEGSQVYSSTKGHPFSDSVRKNILDIHNNSSMDPVSKKNTIVKTMGAAEYSKFKKETPFSTPDRDEVFIDNAGPVIREELQSIGINVPAEDMTALVSGVSNEMRRLARQKQQAIQQDPAKYVRDNDIDLDTKLTILEREEANNRANREVGNTLSTGDLSKQYSEAKEEMADRFEEIGVSPLDANYISKGRIQSDFNTIERLAKPGTGDKKELAIFIQESIEAKGTLSHEYLDSLIQKGLSPSFKILARAPRDENTIQFAEDLVDVVYGADEIEKTFVAKQDIKESSSRTTISQVRAAAQKELDALSGYFAMSGSFNNAREEMGAYRDAVTLRSLSLLNTGKATSVQDAVEKSYDYFIGNSFKEGITPNNSFFIPKRVEKNLNLDNYTLDSIGEVYTDFNNLPTEEIDYISMVSPTYISEKVIPPIAQARGIEPSEVRRQDVEKHLQTKFKEGDFGTISIQDRGDRAYLTITPTEGLALRSTVIRLKPKKGSVNRRAFSIKYKDMANDSRVLEKAKEKREDDKTVLDKFMERFGGK